MATRFFQIEPSETKVYCIVLYCIELLKNCDARVLAYLIQLMR